MQTEYEIEELNGTLAVVASGNLVAQGFGDAESALHAIWGIEGKNTQEFYHEKNGVVTVEIKKEGQA